MGKFHGTIRNNHTRSIRTGSTVPSSFSASQAAVDPLKDQRLSITDLKISGRHHGAGVPLEYLTPPVRGFLVAGMNLTENCRRWRYPGQWTQVLFLRRHVARQAFSGNHAPSEGTRSARPWANEKRRQVLNLIQASLEGKRQREHLFTIRG